MHHVGIESVVGVILVKSGYCLAKFVHTPDVGWQKGIIRTSVFGYTFLTTRGCESSYGLGCFGGIRIISNSFDHQVLREFKKGWILFFRILNLAYNLNYKKSNQCIPSFGSWKGHASPISQQNNRKWPRNSAFQPEGLTAWLTSCVF